MLAPRAYDANTAKSWLFGTNSRQDDEAPIELLGQAIETGELAAVVRAARQSWNEGIKPATGEHEVLLAGGSGGD